jgi:hypothetical protein
MSLNKLKTEMLEMIQLSAEISRYNEMRIYYSNIKDGYNYDLDKVNRLDLKIADLERRFYFLKEKWFD